MTKKKKKKQGGATRGQLALIGILSVVLVIVIVAQLPDASDNATPSLSKKPRRTPRRNVVATSSEKNAVDEHAATYEWPDYQVDKVAQFDPLAPPEWYRGAVEVHVRQPEVAQAKEVVEKLELEDLQKSGANIVLIDGKQRIATVGEQTIRVGDKIDGYQVSEITDQGVVLTKSRSR